MRSTTIAAAAALLASQVVAHPAPSSRNVLQSRFNIELNKYRLVTAADYTDTASTTESISDLNLRLTLFPRADYVQTATELVKKVLPSAQFRVVGDNYVGDNGIAHVNFKQTLHGIDIDNADFNVNIAKDGTVFSYGNSFYTGAIPDSSPVTKGDHVDPIAALKGVSQVLGLPITATSASAQAAESPQTYVIKGTTGAFQDPKARLVYFQTPENTLSLTWRVETDVQTNWLLSYIDAKTSKDIFGVVDYAADVSYQVYPWGVNDPTEGSRSIVSNPWDILASEFTWESDGKANYSTTRGNNGIAQANYEGDNSYLNDYRPVSPSLEFVYGFDLTEPDFKKYSNASVTQLYYTANMYHDLLYELGFTEKAGNFETNNNGQGGIGGDAVILNAQDGSGTNNANFATPPDGQAGRMRMYMWTLSTPQRDCAFDASVILHEYTHGLSNRLTGGPANTACLSSSEAGGMGEGWSDFMALAVQTKKSQSRSVDRVIGAWVFNDPKGIRQYPYSTSLTTNPLTYKSINTQNEVHAIGTTWANILFEVMYNLIDKYGISDDIRPIFDSKGVPTDGRFLTMKLVMNGMALQPCNPNFIQSRDAIIDADKALTGGVNICELWTGFAKRGLGSEAKKGSGSAGRVESFKIPDGVC